MKKTLLLLTFTFIFITTFAQMRKTIITLKDSTELKGLAKIQYGKIIFKANKKAKKQTFDHTTVDNLLLNLKKDANYLKYYYKKVDVFNEYHLLRLFKEGKISIYFEHRENANGVYAAGAMFGLVGVSIALIATSNKNSTPINSKNYYLCKNDSESVFFFSNYNKKFKTEATAYFKDCPSLVTKINDGEFTKNHIAEMINFYNTKCKE